MTTAVPTHLAETCETIAEEARAELGLSADSRLDPEALACALKIRVETIARFRELFPQEIEKLIGEGGETPKAVTIFRGPKCKVLLDPRQDDAEQAYSLAHELAHRLLEHKPRWPVVNDQYELNVREDEEATADYLAGAMLVPSCSLETLLAECGGMIETAAHLGVSVRLVRRRIKEVGIEAPAEDDGEGLLGEILLRRLRPEESGGEPAPSGSPAA